MMIAIGGFLVTGHLAGITVLTRLDI